MAGCELDVPLLRLLGEVLVLFADVLVPEVAMLAIVVTPFVFAVEDWSGFTVNCAARTQERKSCELPRKAETAARDSEMDGGCTTEKDGTGAAKEVSVHCQADFWWQ